MNLSMTGPMMMPGGANSSPRNDVTTRIALAMPSVVRLMYVGRSAGVLTRRALEPASRRPLRDQHATAELADDLVPLVPRHGLDVDDAAIRLRPRLGLVEHGRLRVDGVAVERRH